MSSAVPVEFQELLFDDAELPEDGGYVFGMIAAGLSRGDVSAVKTVLTSLWRDGENSRINHFGNRVVTFMVEMEATDQVAAADGEKALWLACREASDPSTVGTLIFPSFGDGGYPTVWEVLNAKFDVLEDADSDLDEMGTPGQVIRTFLFEVECRPWPRSKTLSSDTWVVESDEPTRHTIPMQGAVTAEGSLTFTSTGSGNVTSLILFTDPALADYDPADPDTWENAPEGLYEVWLKNPGVADDVLTATVGDQVARTRLDGALLNWAPIGSLDLGGRRDGTIGPFTVAIERNDTPVVTPTIRLFRRHETDTALIALEPFDTTELIVDAPGVGHPHGGIWADGAGILADAIGWDFPQLLPPGQPVYVEGHVNTGGGDISVLAEWYERWHTNAGTP